MNTPIRIGIVGLGQRGLQHLKTLWKLQEEGAARVTALCDAFPDNLSEEKIRRYVPGYSQAGVATHTDFDRLMREHPADALYFAVPPGLHDGQVVRAAEAGIHIFAEKPMSLYLDEAKEMDAAIRKAGVISAVGFQLRYDSLNEAARQFLSGKRIVMITMVSHGTLESHSVKHTHTEALGGPSHRVWTASAAWSGTSVVEAGIHQTDLMRFWAGDIAWVQAAYVPRDPQDIEDGKDNPYGYAVTYGFRSGAVGTLLMSRLRRTFHQDGYQIVLWDHGHLKVEGNDLVAYTYEGPDPPPQPPAPSQVRHALPAPPRNDATEALNRAFVNALRQGNTAGFRATFGDSMNSLSAVLAANASHDLGGQRIDLADFLQSPEYAPFRTKPAGRS